MVNCDTRHGKLQQAMFYEARTTKATTVLSDGYRQLLPRLERVGRDG